MNQTANNNPTKSDAISMSPMKANARLIAAAPELLEALDLISLIAEEAYDDPTRSTDARALMRISDLADAALAKATGEESA